MSTDEPQVGLTRDAGWQIGVSRTLPVGRDAAWELLVSPEGLAVWLGGGVESPLVKGEVYRTTDGTAGEVRSVRPLDRVRLTWQPPGRPRDATLQVALSAAKGGCTVHFHVDRLETMLPVARV